MEPIHVPPSLKKVSTTSVPIQPFPFLRLPREIRDLIYSHALVRPIAEPALESAQVCHMHHKVWSRTVATSYWGTERSTRLFRVNRQVSAEATGVFYSNFTFAFHLPEVGDNELLSTALWDIMPERTRNLISKLRISIIVWANPEKPLEGDEERRRQSLEAAAKRLPNLTQIELILSVPDLDVPERLLEKLVVGVVNMTSPLKERPGLALRVLGKETDQREHILSKTREALGCLWSGLRLFKGGCNSTATILASTSVNPLASCWGFELTLLFKISVRSEIILISPDISAIIGDLARSQGRDNGASLQLVFPDDTLRSRPFLICLKWDSVRFFR